MVDREMTLELNVESLDEAIEKANRLVELLHEASQLISSLGMGNSWVKLLTQQVNVEIKKGLADCQTSGCICNSNDNLKAVVFQTLVKQLELLHKRSMVCAEGCFDDDLSELSRAMSAILEHLVSKTNSSF